MGEIMGKSTILMTPPNQNGGTQSVAEILTMYKHIVGGNSMSSAKMAKAMQAGNTDPALRQILQDLEKLKHSQAGGVQTSKVGDDQYKYLDDKTLYSTDG